jgi:peptidoglycan/xylan/chitin deacetylase (PgdA/CDA1 family)
MSELARALALLLLACLAAASSACAGERMLEDLGAAGRFAPLWPAGSLREGHDASRHWLELRTEGTAGVAEHVVVANRAPYEPALDLRGRFVKVWFSVDDLAHLGGMEFRLSSGDLGTDYFAFAIPRYLDLDANVVREGIWNVLTFPFASAQVKGAPERGAIRRIGWYVADRGEGPVSARWAGLAAVEQPAEGVVSFTFDDGYAEHYWAAEQMAKRGMRATAYVIPSAIGSRGYLTEAQLVALRDRLGWEVAAHHVTPFTDFAPAELEPRIAEVQDYLVARGFARGARHLAYPLGKQEPARVRPAVREHFASARVAGGGLETLPPADPHLLRVLNVTQHMTPEQVADAAQRAREDRHWLILMFHYLVEQPAQDTDYRRADFERLLALVEQSGARVLPLNDVFEACGAPTTAVCHLPAPDAAAAPR